MKPQKTLLNEITGIIESEAMYDPPAKVAVEAAKEIGDRFYLIPKDEILPASESNNGDNFMVGNHYFHMSEYSDDPDQLRSYALALLSVTEVIGTSEYREKKAARDLDAERREVWENVLHGEMWSYNWDKLTLSQQAAITEIIRLRKIEKELTES